jgi:transcriptional regulator with XRE-family HTH domain
MNQAELIEEAKKTIQGSEAEVARRVEVSAQALNQFKRGKTPMPDRIAVKLARLAGLDPAQTVTEIEAEQATREMREIRQEIARRTARNVIAMMMALAVGLMPIATRIKSGLRGLSDKILPGHHRLFHH